LAEQGVGETVSSLAGTTKTLYKTLWNGVIDTIEPSVPTEHFRTVTINAVGALSILAANRDIAIDPPVVGSLTGTWIRSIFTAALVDPGFVDAGQSATNYFYAGDQSALTMAREMEETEMGWVYEGGSQPTKVAVGHLIQERVPFVEPNSILNFADRHRRLIEARSLAPSQATFSDDPAAALHFWELEQHDPLAELYNKVQASVQSYVQDATTDTIWQRTGPDVLLAAGESKRFIAPYPNDFSRLIETRIGAFIETWITPTISESLGDDITYRPIGLPIPLTVSSVTKLAKTIMFTVNNPNVSDASLVSVGARCSSRWLFDTVIAVQAEDGDSQTSYGRRSFKLPAKWIRYDTDAQAFCDYVVSRYKDPSTILSLTFMANKDAGSYSQALNRVLNDRITVDADGNSGLGINEDFYIESVSHKIDMGNTRHVVTYELSAVAGDGGYWILGDSLSKLGINTKLGW
jgi:hypothetical protein